MTAAVTRMQPKGETVAQRIVSLQAEAKRLAKDHVAGLCQALIEVESISAAISVGGDAYPPGVRDQARRLVEDCETRVQTLEAIMARAS